MNELPLAFNVERIRAAMLEGILIPRDIVNDSLAELHAQIRAERTLYYTHKGKVVDKRNVADNGARLQAIDQTLSLAGLFRSDDRRSSGSNNAPNFAIEVTPQGVIRIAVGSPVLELNQPVAQVSLDSPREPTVIQSSGPARVEDIDSKVERFNTILDELDE